MHVQPHEMPQPVNEIITVARVHDHLARDGVEVLEIRPGPHLCKRRLLRLQHQVVNPALKRSEFSVDWQRARDVRRVMGELGGHVHQNQFAVLHDALAPRIVKNGRIRS